ncbi:MAG: 50S ribosomal protein L28 [Elusimicrobia bacterium]|nr:50S ribosomal protein L28 [Elusimicrobiota bacterium]
MAFRCALCDKGPVSGNSYSHSHKAVRRVFRPNLQRQKVVVDGATRTVYVCTRCIRSGRAVRPVKV